MEAVKSAVSSAAKKVPVSKEFVLFLVAYSTLVEIFSSAYPEFGAAYQPIRGAIKAAWAAVMVL